jgi:hypothetical protein
MQTYQVQFPAGVPFEVIAQSLKYLGGEIVGRAAVAPVRKAATRKVAKIDADFPPVIARHKETGEIIREIDGITAQKEIAKLMAEVKRGQSSSGRSACSYWTEKEFAAVAKRRPDTFAQEYMHSFCSRLSHVKAQYTNGITA